MFNISTLSFGVHNISARYGGSANFNPSSATLNEAVTVIGTALALTASPNPANTGQAVTLTARANAALAGMVPLQEALLLSETKSYRRMTSRLQRLSTHFPFLRAIGW